MISVSSELSRRIENGDLDYDEAQMSAAGQLDALLTRLLDRQSKTGFLSFGRKRSVEGLYLWGGVGRGKSMLMDWFFEAVPIEHKRRVHFHAFMLDVHARITQWRKLDKTARRLSPDYVRGAGDDPIAPTAKAIARDAQVLCFDEFHVTNIADAMILSRLFEALWGRDVVVVATSNRAPDDLYKNGLNRALFEPFIDLLDDNMVIHEFEGETDHRLRQLSAAPIYYSPLGEKANASLKSAWDRLTGVAQSQPTTLLIQGRELLLERTAAGTVWTSFDRLCAQALGAADYLHLSHAFQTLILENVPQMGPDMRNEAKRFVTLIDALYETRTKLVMSAEVEPDKLYVSGTESFEFERTASRLIEMRSDDYLKARRAWGEGASEAIK